MLLIYYEYSCSHCTKCLNSRVFCKVAYTFLQEHEDREGSIPSRNRQQIFKRGIWIHSSCLFIYVCLFTVFLFMYISSVVDEISCTFVPVSYQSWHKLLRILNPFPPRYKCWFIHCHYFLSFSSLQRKTKSKHRYRIPTLRRRKGCLLMTIQYDVYWRNSPTYCLRFLWPSVLTFRRLTRMIW